jgi:hypothetical protein
MVSGIGPGGFAHDPVGMCLGLEPQVQQFLAAQALDQRGGHDGDDKQQAHDDRRRDLGKENAEFEPQPVQGCEHLRPQQGGRKESDRKRQRPEARFVATQQRRRTDDREDDAEHDAEAALGADPYVVVPNALVFFVLDHALSCHKLEANALAWPDATTASDADTATTAMPANDKEPEERTKPRSRHPPTLLPKRLLPKMALRRFANPPTTTA